jgi:streptogramin lyase
MHARFFVLTLSTLALLVPATRAQEQLLVTSRNTDQVLRYDLASGAFLGVAASGGGLDNPVGLTFGPHGDLFVASDQTDSVLRYDASGAFLGVAAQGNGLDAPRQVNFGPDGMLYVASGATNQILRFDPLSGAFLGVFASGGALNGPTSFTFGPSGDLYVGSVNTNRVKRYDGTSGAFVGNFVTTNLHGPHDLAFGPDGLLYVSNAFEPRVRRYDGTSGAFVDSFIVDPALSGALGLCWDDLGRLYVANQGGNEVRRYDGETGAYLDSPVAPGAGGLSGPLFLCFARESSFTIHAPTPGIAGAANWLAVSGATSGASLRLAAGRPRLLAVLPGCPRSLGLPETELLVPCIADESGRALFRWQVPPTLGGVRIFLRAAEPANCRASPIVGFCWL